MLPRPLLLRCDVGRHLLPAALALALLGAQAPQARRVSPAALPHLDPVGHRLLLVMIDGLPVAAFDEARQAGEMPHLATLLAQRPTLSTVAFSTLPSSTSPSVQEFLSGRYASLRDADVPDAVHAFDREEHRVVRYFTQPDAWEWPVADLFDAVEKAGLAALTVFEGRWDGPQSILTRGPIVRDGVLEKLGVEAYNGDRGPVRRLLRRLHEPDPPEVILLVFNAVDMAGHFHGPESSAVRQALRDCDELLGEVLETLRAVSGPSGRSLFADTTVLLFGDHGMVPSGNLVDLQPTFQRRGLITFDASSASQVLFRERLGSLWANWPDVLLVAGGSNITQVYLRRPDGTWGEHDPNNRAAPWHAHGPAATPASFVREVTALAGVAQVFRSLPDGSIEISASGGGLAWVVPAAEEGSARTAYVVPGRAQSDPLGYLADPGIAPAICREGAVAARCFLSREQWLERTAEARYPYAVPLIPKFFRADRFAGDLIVTSLPGFTFLKGQRGDHGNLEREAMTTPLLINGPDIDPTANLGHARLIDLYPTLAVLLGASPEDPALKALDGRVLPVLRRPGVIACSPSGEPGARRGTGGGNLPRSKHRRSRPALLTGLRQRDLPTGLAPSPALVRPPAPRRYSCHASCRSPPLCSAFHYLPRQRAGT